MNFDNIQLKNFIDLSEKEKLLVLMWRNHINTRHWMYNSDIISTENHFNFIQSLKESDDRIYFLVVQNSINIGVIYLTDINYQTKSSEFGLYANPKIKGVGQILLSLIIAKVFIKLNFIKLNAEVFSDNKRAISLYSKNSFKEYKRNKINEKEIIYMELTNETR